LTEFLLEAEEAADPGDTGIQNNRCVHVRFPFRQYNPISKPQSGLSKSR
jgi:hypothetical protein